MIGDILLAVGVVAFFLIVFLLLFGAPSTIEKRNNIDG